MQILALVGNESLVWVIATVVVASILLPYIVRFKKRGLADELRKQEASRLGIDRPVAQYPWVDPERCVGCATCVGACPEGDVLGLVGGIATVINGLRCIGLSHCQQACPLEAIQVGLGDVRGRTDMPLLDDAFQTSVPGIYIAGELGGLALVRNATLQGKQVVEHIAERIRAHAPSCRDDVLDVAIIGAGPAGLSAGFAARSAGLSHTVFEREKNLGGTILKYPRRKMVLTQSMDFGAWGTLGEGEYQKEKLLDIFTGMVKEANLAIAFDSPIDSVKRENGHFVLNSSDQSYRSRFILLSLGRRGTPRKLQVPGEELSKVMYRLIDAESYSNEKILVVGGGDSAVEAACSLAQQPGNEVTLSYRKPDLVRIKKRNQDRIGGLISTGRIRAVFSSHVKEIRDQSVVLQVADSESVEIENDYVFIFAGGVPPFGFLKEMGVRFGGEEPTADAPTAAPPLASPPPPSLTGSSANIPAG